MLQVELLVVIPLLHTGVPADRRHVDHAVAELDEGAALDRDVQVRHVVQQEPHQPLVLVLAEPLDEALARQRLAHPVRRQPVLREAEVEQRRHGDRVRAELFLLFRQVAAAHEADGDFVPDLGEEL